MSNRPHMDFTEKMVSRSRTVRDRRRRLPGSAALWTGCRGARRRRAVTWRHSGDGRAVDSAVETRSDLTDAQWERLEPLLPVSSGRCRLWRDHRQVVNGVLHRIRTGVQWRDLPERYGPYERHRRWSADGTWHMLLQRIQAEEDATGTIDWDISVDSTVVRAHHHGAGARRAQPPEPDASLRPAGWPGRAAAERPAGGGEAGEILGRSRGGCQPLRKFSLPGPHSLTADEKDPQKTGTRPRGYVNVQHPRKCAAGKRPTAT